MPPSSSPSSSRRSASSAPSEGDDRAVEQDARDVADEEDSLRAEPDGERGGGLVGVDVQRPLRERRDDRDPARRERGSTAAAASAAARRRARARAPAARRGRSRRPSARPRAAERRAELRVDPRERLAHEHERGGARDAPAADELDASPAAHLRRDLRPGTVDDAHLVPSATSSRTRRGPAATAPPILTTIWSRAVVRVDADVVGREVARQVARAAGAEPEVELDRRAVAPATPARRRAARRARARARRRSPSVTRRIEPRVAAVERRRAGRGEHAAPVRVVSVGSAVLTSGEVAMRRAIAPFASSAAPVTRSRATTVTPSPSATILPGELRRTPRRAPPSNAASSRARATAPFASSTTVSFVEHSPSTEIALKLSLDRGRGTRAPRPARAGSRS